MSELVPAPRERRKRRAAGSARTGSADPQLAPAERPRGAERDEAARTALEPLAPGERPPALLAAVALASALGLGNAIAYAAGATIGGKHPGAGVLAFSAAMALLAVGMWTKRYLAVLAFEALLALIVLFFSLFLVEAGNVLGLVVCVFVVSAAGWLFWKLVRVMGRLAAPRSS
jgi:hypothetical protein